MNSSPAYWLGSEGSSLLALAAAALDAAEGDSLRAGMMLRRDKHNIFSAVAPALLAEAVELVLLRRKAHAKGLGGVEGLEGLGDWVLRGFFTRQSLEQATTPLVAQHHAERFAGCKHVLEICTGAGFDAAAIARVLARTGGVLTTIEADETLADFARANLAAQGLTNVRVLCGLAEALVPALMSAESSTESTIDGLWSDPSRRRSDGSRIDDAEQYKPALSFVLQTASSLASALASALPLALSLALPLALPVRADGELVSAPPRFVAGVKLAPALDLSPVLHEHLAANKWATEWIGVAGECREQVLWCGVEAGTRRVWVSLIGEAVGEADGETNDEADGAASGATVWSPCPSTGSSTGSSTDISLANSSLVSTDIPSGWLLEPHSALIRSGVLAEFYAERGFKLFDEHIAYGLSAVEPPESAFYQVFKILEAFPYKLKTLRDRIKSRDWGTQTEIKKRGFPDTPETVRAALRLEQVERLQQSEQQASGVIILTRRGSSSSKAHQHWCILAERV
jgi:hypothetical protein